MAAAAHHDEERRAQQQGHHGHRHPGHPGVDHQRVAGGEGLHGGQCGEQRHRQQVGDPGDHGLLEPALRHRAGRPA